MRAIFIDTATERGLIAVTENDRVVISIPLSGFDQSKFLLPGLHRMLQENSISLSSIDCIAAGIGPGSYTGIRIGVSAAKTLAYALHIPLIGISSLFSFVPLKKNISFAALVDAKIGGAYFLIGRLDPQGNIIGSPEPQISPIDQLDRHLNETYLLFSPAIHSLKSKMNRISGEDLRQWEEIPPSAVHIARLIRDRYEEKDWSLDGRIPLLYLRKTEAELQKEQTRKRDK